MANLQKQFVTIPAHSTATVNIPGLAVNYFRVVNGGTTALYCGLSNMPNENYYDFKVPSEAAKLYAEEKTYKQIYIMNAGTEPAPVLLYTFSGEFDPLVLALGDTAEAQAAGQVNVEIDGFRESLPSGNNMIGRVTLENLVDYTADLDTVNSNILKVVAALGGYTGNGGGGGGFVPHYIKSKAGTATSTAITYTATDGRKITELALFANDGDGAISLIVVDPDGTQEAIMLNAGEVLDNVKIYASSLKVSGDGAFRLVYNEAVGV